MAILQRITSSGYTVEVVWECQFDKDILPHHRELKQHTIVQHAPLNTRDALYGGRTEAMVLHNAIRGETIQSERPFRINQRIAKLRSDFRCLSVRRRAVETLFP